MSNGWEENTHTHTHTVENILRDYIGGRGGKQATKYFLIKRLFVTMFVSYGGTGKDDLHLIFIGGTLFGFISHFDRIK